MYEYPKNFIMTLLSWIFIYFVIASGVQCKSFVLQHGKSSATLVKRQVPQVFQWSPPRESSSAIKPDIYSFTVTSNIAYRYATTTISNRMANPANSSKELFFTVTLPDSAFISKFLMVIKDKVYEAYVKEKEEARKDYQDAVSRGETAGHVELSARDSNLFTVSVNVEAHNKVTFNLTYEQLLTRMLGQYENVINVNPGQIVKTFRIDVNIEESAPISSLDVPDLKTSNEINAVDSKNIDVQIERPTNNSGKVTWSPDSEQQQQLSAEGVHGQLIVRYDVDRSSESSQILVDEGYFVHFFAPANLKTLNKHVLFALDISGSMGGRKIDQLRESMELILSDISEDDFFSLILFSDQVQLWSLEGTAGDASPAWSYDEVTTKAPVEINDRFIIPAKKENIEKAKAFAKTLNETGGTNIIAALRKSLQIANWGQKTYKLEAKPLIVFLTDGQPNVEVSDPEEIIKSITKQNVEKYPLFSLGFGDGADYEFLRKVSLSNGGFARNIYVASDTSLQLKNFYKQIASPLLSNVSFAYIPGQIDENTLTKSIFNNLYNGSELVVAGKLTKNSNTLTGNMTATASEGHFCIEMPHEIPLNKTPGHLEKLWAYLYIKELLDKDLISDQKNSSFKQKALNLSLHYGFVTPLTSLVVVKPNDSTVDNHKPVAVQPENAMSSNSFPVALRGSAHIAPLSFSAASSASMSVPAPPFVGNSNHYSQQAPIASASYAFIPPQFAPIIPNFPSTLLPVAFRYSKPSALIIGHQNATFTTHLPEWLSLGYSAIDIRFADMSTTTMVQGGSYDDGIPEASLLVEDDIEMSTIPAFDSVDSVNNATGPLNISDITWLHNKTEIKFPSSNNSYSIFPDDAPDTEFQLCIVPNGNNTVSHCRHLAHCVLPEILQSFNDFVPYGESCVIDARFVGICCPPEHVSQKVSSTTSTPTTSVTS